MSQRHSFTVDAIKTWTPASNSTGLRWAGLCIAFLAAPLSLRSAELPSMLEYRIGDQVEADIVTPLTLVVFDPVRTGSLRQAEAQAVNAIVRHLSGTGVEGATALKTAFTNEHVRFVAGLEKLFGHPLPLLNAEFDEPRFGDFLKSCRAFNPGFPLTGQLAELWAFGDDGQIVLDRLIMRFERVSNRLVLPDGLSAGGLLGGASVRLVAAANLNTPIPLAISDREGRDMPFTNLVSLADLRQEIDKAAPSAEKTEARFIAGFLRPNCYLDPESTRRSRARRTEVINVADRYEAGQVIVKQGEVVTEKIKLALDELQSRTAARQIQASADRERSRVTAEVSEARRTADETLQANRWLLGALGVAAIAFVSLGLFLFTRRRALQDGRRRAAAAGGHALVVHSASEDAWRERALEAEARARKATAMLRTKMLPHMARWMMQEFMQRMMLQRRSILTEQQTAEREVAELAERLENVHAPLEERLRAYERRITELEAQLADRGGQNLEWIKTRIETTRKKLEGERDREEQDTLNLG